MGGNLGKDKKAIPSQGDSERGEAWPSWADGPLEVDSTNWLGNPDLGVTAWQALYHFVRQESAAHLFRLRDEGYDDEDMLNEITDTKEREEARFKNFMYRMALKELSDDLFRKLWSGQIMAKGVSSTNALGAAQNIPAERWELLDLDVWNSSATGPGFEVFNIRVFSSTRNPNVVAIAQKRISMAELVRWYKLRVNDASKKGIRWSREQDLKAAREEFANMVTEVMVREVRSKHAPSIWKQPGARQGRR